MKNVSPEMCSFFSIERANNLESEYVIMVWKNPTLDQTLDFSGDSTTMPEPYNMNQAVGSCHNPTTLTKLYEQHRLFLTTSQRHEEAYNMLWFVSSDNCEDFSF